MLARAGPCGYILRKFSAPFRSFAVLQDAYAAGRDVGRVQANDASLADFDIKAEPVSAEHASRRIERHRSGNEAFELRSGANYQALAYVLCPSHAADQRVIEEAAFEGHGLGKFTQLQELEQDRNFRQVGDYNTGLGRRKPLQLNMQLR